MDERPIPAPVAKPLTSTPPGTTRLAQRPLKRGKLPCCGHRRDDGPCAAPHKRKGADGLAALVRETLRLDPSSGMVFVFRAKPADRVDESGRNKTE